MKISERYRDLGRALWVSSLIGVAAALALTAFSQRCLTPAAMEHYCSFFFRLYPFLWPASSLIPPLVNSVAPSRTDLWIGIAIVANAIPYAMVGAVYYALGRRFKSTRHSRLE